MKNNVIILAGGLAAMVTAQDNVSECGRVCLTNMRGLAGELGCGDQAEGDALNRCLCSQANYAYGINDCSAQSCSTEESTQLVQFARSECQRLGINWDSVSGGADGTAVIPVASESVTGVATDLTATDGTATTGATDLTSALETTTIGAVIATITSDGQTITTTLPVDDTTSILLSESTLETDAAVSTGTATDISTFTTTATGTEGGDEASGTGDASSTETTGDDSPAVRVAAPMIGFIVAAGMAAGLL